MPATKYTPEEIASRGDAIYESRLRDQVESENRDRFLILDIESEEYEIADDDLAATMRLLARRPNAVIYGLRIGHSAAYRIGACLSTDEQ
jgi:hypothetical protein